MSARRRKPPRVTPTARNVLALWPTPTASASAKVRLALQLRNEANATGRCACGAVAEVFEVLEDGSLRPRRELVRGRRYYARFEHEDDCPAVSPDLQRALERGEINDPGGDLSTARDGDV